MLVSAPWGYAMSAVVLALVDTPQYSAELQLRPSRTLRRRLDLHLLRGMLFVNINASRCGHLGSANAFMTSCYLDMVGDYPALHVAGTYFIVSSSEAARIRTSLESHGLRIREAP